MDIFDFVAGWTPLHASIRNDNLEMTQWLLDKGADPTLAMTTTGWTPAHEAELKKKGADYLKALQGPATTAPDASELKTKEW